MEGIISKETGSVRRFFGLLDNIQTKLERLAEDNRPLFNGERFLSDKELSDLLRISRRCLQDYRDQGVFLISGWAEKFCIRYPTLRNSWRIIIMRP